MSDVLLQKYMPANGFGKNDFPYPYRGGAAYFNDFLEWTTANASATNNSAVWRSGGAGTPTYTPADDFDGGAVILTTTTAANDEAGLQLGGASYILPAATTTLKARQMRFACRFRTSSITTTSQFLGMWEKDAVTTAPLSPLTGTQPKGIGFVIVSGVVNYITKPHSGSAVTATPVGFGSIAINTDYDFALEMDGDNNFNFIINGKSYLTLNSVATPTSSTVGLSPAFGIKTINGAAVTMTVDYVYAATDPSATAR